MDIRKTSVAIVSQSRKANVSADSHTNSIQTEPVFHLTKRSGIPARFVSSEQVMQADIPMAAERRASAVTAACRGGLHCIFPTPDLSDFIIVQSAGKFGVFTYFQRFEKDLRIYLRKNSE